MMLLLRAAAAAALLVALCAAAEDAPIPPLTGRVVDINGALTAGQKRELEASLEAFETRNGSRIAVLITGRLSPSLSNHSPSARQRHGRSAARARTTTSSW